ncbi:alpha/beta hydrolase [Hymenobacter sp. H14-R3]|uniref:alpha/beta fold hydrolase n=1 Tax=Hymenobacter sp. H14-R3 TaxID=3046308 RepID=UPI0024BBC35B|nr:alpha/beta hydrolase [Hymenobacter sp. H14-R3]MDJ0363795.1 alpha/beta hydrolase [Hymenobacter sp. H14-R3]
MTTYLALHYWAGSGHEFEPLLPLLPPGSHLLAPDLPGFGSQAAPAGFDYSVASYADWVAQYVEDNKLVDYQIIGHSMSGKIALALAARQPAGLRGLLLLSPSPPTPEPISDADRAASLAAYGQRAEAESTFTKITSIPLSDEQRAQVIADNLRTTQAAWDAWLLRGSREDISALMPRIAVPCRLLVGENDRAIPLAAQRQQTLPLLPAGSALVAVPGAGHLLPLEAPEVIFSA